LGFVPLTDAAPLLVADALGLFARHGVRVGLSRMAAWAAMRDRIAFGGLDGGQMLSPMPIAARLGLGGVAASLAVVATLARHGNTLTFSDALLAEIERAAPDLARQRPLPAAALAACLAARRAQGREAPSLAVVYAYSSHTYLLRHWLSEAGIDPERDVRLVVVPPPLVAGELAEGHIDGFCAGEPWGSRAVDLRVGRIVLTTADIWLNHPEKVLAVSAQRLARDPEQIEAVVAAVLEAGVWLTDPANLADATRIVHRSALPEVPETVVARALARSLVLAPDEPPTPVPGLQFHLEATYPHPEHGAWWASQMLRWGHVDAVSPGLIEDIWRPDVWRRAAPRAGLSPRIPTLPACPGEHIT
jgi:ABC-type nitrate/sulfonate/bicarbonate transport system substrate-binding protein